MKNKIIGKSISEEHWCPFCPKVECEHFKGYTEDGKNLLSPNSKPIRLLDEKDYIIPTGVSNRVYRNS